MVLKKARLIPKACVALLPLFTACATAEKFEVEGSNRKTPWYQRAKTRLSEAEKVKLRSGLRFAAPVSLGLSVGTLSTFGKNSSPTLESATKPEAPVAESKILLEKLPGAGAEKWKLHQKLYRIFFQLGDLHSSRRHCENTIEALKNLAKPNSDLEYLVALSDAYLHLALISPQGNAKRSALDSGAKYFEMAFGRNADIWSLVNTAMGLLQNPDAETLKLMTVLSRKLIQDIDKNKDPLGILVMAVFIDYMNAFSQAIATKQVQFTESPAFRLLRLRAAQLPGDNRYMVMVHFFELFEIFFTAMLCDQESMMSFEKPIACLPEGKKSRLVAIKNYLSSPEVLKYETADIYNYAAMAAFLSRDYDKAIHLWEKAVEFKPTDSGLNGTLVFAYVKSGAPAKALSLLQQKVRMREGVTGEDYLRLALIYNDNDQLEEFRDACKIAAKQKNSDPKEPMICLIIASLRLDDVETVWPILKSLAAYPKLSKGELAQIHYHRAVALLLRDNHRAAFLELHNAAKLRPEAINKEITALLDDHFLNGYEAAVNP